MSNNRASKDSQNDLVLPHQPHYDEFLQTMTKLIHCWRWIGIVGLESLIWKLWGSILLCLFLAIEGEAIWKIIKALVGWAIDVAGHRSVTARLAGTMFYSAALLSLIQCWRLSCSWKENSKYWASIEWALNIQYVPADKTIKKRMYTVVLLLTSFASLEHLLDMAGSFDFNCPLSSCLRKYILKSHGFMLLEHEYSTWIGVPLFFLSLVATFLWNLQDMTIILISMGLASRYKRLNQWVRNFSIRDNKTKPWTRNSSVSVVTDRRTPETEFINAYMWRKIREAYVKQSMLVRKVDQSLGVLILQSAFFNFYFICLQLFLRIIHGVSLGSIKQIYYTVSLTWLCTRTSYTVLAAADVNKNSYMALPYLYDCQMYNIEIERLQKQLSRDYVALTGMGFFYLNRTFVLQMAGAVVTYVLVLIQYDDTDTVSPTNSTSMN